MSEVVLFTTVSMFSSSCYLSFTRVIAILSGYIERYGKDDLFRNTIREKCSSYLVRRKNSSESDCEILVNMKLGIENIDKVQDQGTKKQL